MNRVAQNGLIIQLGEHDLSRGESTEQVIRSSQIIIVIYLFISYVILNYILKLYFFSQKISKKHETYTGSDFDALRGDIALVRLSRPATINAYVKTVCLPSANEDIAPIGSQVYVTGWVDILFSFFSLNVDLCMYLKNVLTNFRENLAVSYY